MSNFVDEEDFGEQVEDFAYRMKVVLGGRRPHSWGSAMGLGKAVTHQIFTVGRVPRAETLATIAQVERVGLGWLTGEERLFPPKRFEVELLEDVSLFRDAVWDSMMIIYGANLSAICLGGMETLKRDSDEPIRHRRWQVLRGPIHTHHLRDVTDDCRSPFELRVRQCSEREMREVVRGEMGNWWLFGDFGGTNKKSLWNTAEKMDPVDEVFGVESLIRLTEQSDRQVAPYMELSALWDRIPEGRREIAWAFLKVLSGEQVTLPVPASDPPPHKISNPFAALAADLANE